MRTDAYLAALRAAMKVTFSAAFVSGCGARDGGKPPVSTESDVGAPHGGAEGTAKPHAAAPPDAGPNCGEAFASFDAEMMKYSEAEDRAMQDARNATAKGERSTTELPAVPRPTPVLMACCRAELSKDRTMGAHYNTCCRANGLGSEVLTEGGEDFLRACSPWGPPVPPPMWPLRGDEVTGTA